MVSLFNCNFGVKLFHFLEPKLKRCWKRYKISQCGWKQLVAGDKREVVVVQEVEPRIYKDVRDYEVTQVMSLEILAD